MPKVYLTADAKKDEEFRRLVKMAMAREGIYTQRELAKRLICKELTVSKRLREPDTISRRELRNYCKVLKISAEEIGAVVV